MLDTIFKRHCFRGEYDDIPVPREDLIKIVEAGMAAPSGCNKQTTSFIIVDDSEVLSKIKSVIDPPVAETAPAAICVVTHRIYAYRDKCYAVQDYSAAIENMLLAIVELGYESCWYEGHITDDDGINHKMEKILSVPDGYEIVCFLPVGVAKDKIIPPKKKSFAQRVGINSFNQEINI